MKRWLAISLAILTTIAMTLPALAAPALTPYDDVPNKMHVVVYASSLRTGSGVTYSGSIRCTTIEGEDYWVYMGYASAAIYFDTWGFTCLGSVTVSGWYQYPDPIGCPGKGYFQDARAAVHVTYSTNKNGQPYVAGTIYYDADAQTDGMVWGPDGPPWPATVGIGDIAGEVWHGGRTAANWNCSPNSVTNYIYVHDTVKPPCDQNWEDVQPVGYGTIDATNEDGNPETLVAATSYRLTVSGGPWNDSATDRYDTAVKIGADDWIPLSDWANSDQVECSEGDPLDPTKTTIYFTAVEVDWAIRVNDIADLFSDNTGGMDYLLEELQPLVPYDCSDQYLIGALVGVGVINSTLSTGTIIPNLIATSGTGTWIAITTSGGPWKDNPAGDDRYDVAMNNSDGTWPELTEHPYTACHTHDGNYVTAYVQLSGTVPRLRVNDTGGNWSSNTGTMVFTVYRVIYSPIPPGGCSETYQLGDLVTTLNVPGSSMVGLSADLGTDTIEIPPGDVELPQRYYAIETSGIWYNGSTPSTAAEMATGLILGWDWSSLAEFPDVTCAVTLDPIGHMRVYITSIQAARYWFRAQDNGLSRSDNSGTLTFMIYEATNLQVPPYFPGPMPGPGICDPYYSHEDTGATSTLFGNSSTGNILPILTVPKLYAVETAAGPWLENGTESYEVAISEDNGTTWHVLSNYPSALCAQSDDGDHILVYFQALAGRQYKLRVYDPYVTYANNTDSIDYIFYDQITTIIDPWLTCSDNYIIHPVTMTEEERTIPANSSAGKPVPYIESGKTYAIEIMGTSYWNYPGTPNEHHYDATVKSINGATWDVIDPALPLAECVVQTNTASVDREKTYRFYFTAEGNYVLYANIDPYVIPATVKGFLIYYLYKTEQTDVPPVPPGPPVPPPWLSACFETYQRPGYLFKNVLFQIPSISFGSLGSINFPAFSVPLPAVDDWLSYLGWSIRNYFAWCPMHTAALAAIPTNMGGLEPFGVMNEISLAFAHLNDLLDGLSASGGEGDSFTPYSVIFNAGGGEGDNESWQGILPVISADSPWMGAPLQWNGGNGVHIDTTGASNSLSDATAKTLAYADYCQGNFDAHMGAALSYGMCMMLSMARTAPVIWILLQILADCGAVWGIVLYLQKKWIDLRGSG